MYCYIGEIQPSLSSTWYLSGRQTAKGLFFVYFKEGKYGVVHDVAIMDDDVSLFEDSINCTDPGPEDIYWNRFFRGVINIDEELYLYKPFMAVLVETTNVSELIQSAALAIDDLSMYCQEPVSIYEIVLRKDSYQCAILNGIATITLPALESAPIRKELQKYEDIGFIYPCYVDICTFPSQRCDANERRCTACTPNECI